MWGCVAAFSSSFPSSPGGMPAWPHGLRQGARVSKPLIWISITTEHMSAGLRKDLLRACQPEGKASTIITSVQVNSALAYLQLNAHK